MKELLNVSQEVADALAETRPVVALESTIIAHGMPYPTNIETALEVEAIIREEGAIPATIAVLDGQPSVGLSKDALHRLATGKEISKLSRRDMAVALARGADGATTVATTMMIADLAGICVFATGGIGGVHRGAEASFDVSADLQELARRPVAVVCAGAKSILDLPKTLEVLETLGVPVIGHGTDTLPAFFARSSGLALPHRADTPAELAEIIHHQRQLDGAGGLVIANPVPESDAMPAQRIDSMIEAALVEAEQAEISGKEMTPFLLAKLADLTGGDSLRTNIALIKNNARLAARIASSLCRIASGQPKSKIVTNPP
ncbi:MAG: pseudouridine-5'-phosphate glycosidase [Pseudomonadota bacterium]